MRLGIGGRGIRALDGVGGRPQLIEIVALRVEGAPERGDLGAALAALGRAETIGWLRDRLAERG